MRTNGATAMNAKRIAFAVALMLMLLFIGSVVANGPGAGQLTEQEKRGKFIYLRGASPSGREISCYLADGTMEVPASAMLCANCHGFDGRGNPEGGVVPSDITWEALTKTYGITHTSGRKHPAYTDRALAMAVTRGVDPAGNKLPNTMPRYWMAPEDLADLVAYIKRLGKDQDPGLTETSIRVGAIVAGEGPMAEMGQAMKEILGAYFEEVNAQGGIYNRKIELRVANSPADPRAARSNAERFIDDEQVFAMAGAFIAGADKEITSLVEEKEVVLVGPSTLYPDVGFPLNRHTFYLFSGLKEQATALVNFIGEKLQKQSPRLAIVCPDKDAPEGVSEALEEHTKKRAYRLVTKISYSRKQFDASQLVKKLNEAGADAIFFLGSGGEDVALMKEAVKIKWTPYVLIPGSLASKEILDAPPAFKDKVFFSFPTLPSDQTRDGIAEFVALAQKHNLQQKHIPAQISGYCAAKILVEGLKLTGKELSREKLIKTLEGLYNFDTGLSPRISYGPNRRIGALGAYIVTIDPAKKQFIPASEWITAE
ncbi:MAG: ABC transporter substrate-binding protein [Blastocatellia bacterium]